MKLILLLGWASLSWAFQTMNCRESCQYFDNFDKSCRYQTRCEIGSDILRYYSCEKFDHFDHRCLSESVQVAPFQINPFAGAPACTESCQFFDHFTGECLYRTSCEYSGKIMKFTSCEGWDDFSLRCNSEEHTYRWNVY